MAALAEHQRAASPGESVSRETNGKRMSPIRSSATVQAELEGELADVTRPGRDAQRDAQPRRVPARATRRRRPLAAMAEGTSNRGIADALVISVPAVEKHIPRIFDELEIDAGDSEHRRVHAVLKFLRES